LTHFLNMAIVNSFIWYSAVFPERKLSHYQFRERLIDDLVKAQLEKQVKEDANIFPRSLSKKKWSKEQSRRVGAHWPVQFRKPEGSRVEGLNPTNPTNQRTRNWFRGACMLCGRSVDMKCEQCRVWLCCQFKENTGSSCFRDFHTKSNLLHNESLAANDGSDEKQEADEEN